MHTNAAGVPCTPNGVSVLGQGLHTQFGVLGTRNFLQCREVVFVLWGPCWARARARARALHSTDR